MTVDQVLFAVTAPVCLGAAIFAITRRDARSSAIGLVVTLLSTGLLFFGLGAVLLALIQVLLYAICATIPLFAALHRLAQLRHEPPRAGRPALALAGALVGIALYSVLSVAILRTELPPVMPDAAIPVLIGGLDSAALELFGRLALASAALFMVIVAALITSVAARRISNVAEVD
ncbi:MAG: NADH-quinone oxidoreductase subunit J [Chloroflexota bacterium]